MTIQTTSQVIQKLKMLRDLRVSSWGIVMIGLPGSGKSTFVKKVQADFPDVHIASTDDMIDQIAAEKGCTYSEAFQKHVNMKVLKKRMLADLKQFAAVSDSYTNVISDQTNMSKKSRREKLELMPNHVKIALTFEVPLVELHKRLDARAAATGKFIPNSVLNSMLANYQAPTKAEGFTHIWELAQ